MGFFICTTLSTESTWNMRFYHCFLFALSLVISLWGYSQNHITQKEALIIGQTIKFKSTILEEERQLNVYLPLDYSPDSIKTYPVIYVLDGSMDEDFLHIAGVVQFASFPWLAKIPECIVVGIANTNRYHDFTYPTSIPKYTEINPDNGGSADFIRFLKEEVKPLIESDYKTSGNSTLVGQSLGGLLAAEILIKQPDIFQHYLIVSPSLWWDDQSLLKEQMQATSATKQVFIAVGKEGRVMKQVARRLKKKVQSEMGSGAVVGFTYYPKLNHGNIMHEAVYDGLPHLFE